MKATSHFLLAALVAILLLASPVFAEQRFVISSARELPISATVDVLVVGGNEGGVAAAWKAARGGASAIVLTENYFLSDDVSAKARYWLEGDEVPRGEFARALFKSATGEDPSLPTPWQYKMRIEDVLREAGVQYQYNTRPIAALCDASGDIAGVAVANKAGVQAIVAKVVIDATPTGAVARMMGARTTPWQVEQVEVSRVAYQTNVPGSKRFGDFYEYALNVPMATGSWPERSKAEVLLRDKYISTNWKMTNKAHAQKMHMVEPVSIITESTLTGTSWPNPEDMDLGVFRPKSTAYLYVLSQSAGVSRDLAERLTRPVHLANVGERIGDIAGREAAERAAPQEPTVVTPEPGQCLGRPGVEVRELRHGHRRWFRNQLGTVSQPELPVPIWGKYEIVVVGGGPAGMSAAIAAGRAGAKVLLIEMLGQIGGNFGLGVDGYWRGYHGGFNQEKLSFPLVREAGVDIWLNTLGCGALVTDNRVVGVTVATHLGRGAVLGDIIIDAGDGDIVAAAGGSFNYLNRDLAIQESSYRKMSTSEYLDVLPLDVADVTGVVDWHYCIRKLGQTHNLGDDAYDFLAMAGIRETRLIDGEYKITVLDQVTRRNFPDLISVSLSAYDPHGYHDGDYLFAGVRPINKRQANFQAKEGVFTYVPFRALLPRGLEGILVAGRCYSGSHDAQASLRMNPDMINMGYAGGYAAAMAVQSGQSLRQLDLRPVQEHLVQIGNLTPEHLSSAREAKPPTEAALKAAAADPKSGEELAILFYAGKRSLPSLRESFAAAPTVNKGVALCTLGDAAAVPYLSAWLNSQDIGQGDRYTWDNFIQHREIEAVMWCIGIPEDERAIDALVQKLRQCDLEDNWSRIRAITGALGRIGSPKAAQALHDFLLRPGVSGHARTTATQDDIKAASFSKAYTELFAATALVRCGDLNGLGRSTLESYLNDWRGIFHRYAGHLLYAASKSTR